MAAWTLVPCLNSLRAEFTALAPVRDRQSDGSIGDTAHSQSSSDHNPDETGATPYEDADSLNEVHAIDVDVDLRKPGWTMERAVQVIVLRHRAGRDNRLQNVIYNRRIWSRSWGWTARAYNGPNPHDQHAHFGARYTTAQENDTRPWGLLEADDMLDTSDKAWLESLVETRIAQLVPDLVRKAVWDGVLWAGDGAPSAKVAFQRTYTNAAALPSIATALAQRADVDEAVIVAGVLAGLTPAAIAAAIPPAIAEQVADELRDRLAA
jgi:hypothetical protein